MCLFPTHTHLCIGQRFSHLRAQAASASRFIGWSDRSLMSAIKKCIFSDILVFAFFICAKKKILWKQRECRAERSVCSPFRSVCLWIFHSLSFNNLFHPPRTSSLNLFLLFRAAKNIWHICHSEKQSLVLIWINHIWSSYKWEDLWMADWANH